MTKQSQKQFLQWLEQRDPALFLVVKKSVAMQEAQKGMESLGAVTGDQTPQQSNVWSMITDTIKNVAPTLLQLPYQKKAMDLQMKRAEQGLPPLDMTQYSPTIKVAADITPEMEKSLTNIAAGAAKESGGAAFTKMLPYAAAALGAYAFLGKKKR